MGCSNGNDKAKKSGGCCGGCGGHGNKEHGHQHDHDHAHDHDHDQKAGCCGGKGHGHQHDHAHDHDHGQKAGCCGGKGHDHPHEQGHEQKAGCCSGAGKNKAQAVTAAAGHQGVYQRSHEPIVWSLFGGGGMLAAFVTPALLLCTALLAPLGLLGDGLAFERVSALANHWLGALIIWAVIALPLWHALHRIYHSLHDLKVGARTFSFVLCYGAALLLTLYCGYLLFLA
jgi:fumarate reductase subunit D